MLAHAPLVLLSTILCLPYALASAASQFHLDVTTYASKCFVLCHVAVTSSVDLPGVDDNTSAWFAQNCAFDVSRVVSSSGRCVVSSSRRRVVTPICDYTEWVSLMSLCLVVECTSAPDVAYAVEYGTSLCHRGGVDNVVIPVPQSYLDGVNGSYFTSAEYLESSATQLHTPGIATLAVALLSGLVGLALLY